MRIDGRRILKPLAVFVVTACAFIAGHSAPRQRIDPGLATLGGGFVSDTAKVNGTTLHYVRGGTGPQEKTAIVFGQNIRYIEAGQGHALILLHGLGGAKEHWSGNFAALASKYHVYALDQLGFGHSDKPMIDYKIATWVDFLQGFMQSQNIPTAIVVGNSLGGWVATEFAVQHPEMVEKLVLVDAAGLAGVFSIEQNLRPLRRGEVCWSPFSTMGRL